MKIKNMFIVAGFLLSSSLCATTEGQPEVMRIQLSAPVEAPTQSFVDKVKSVDWMTEIDGGKKGLFKGLTFQLIQSFLGGAIGQTCKEKNVTTHEWQNRAANQVVQELVYQIDQATSHQTQGAEYVAENVGRLVSICLVAMISSDRFKPSAKRIAALDTFKASIQRLCDSSIDDFSADKKAIAQVIMKSLLRGLASLPVIDDLEFLNSSSSKFNPRTDTTCYAKDASYELDFTPHLQSSKTIKKTIALALSNTFFPLLVDGGLKFASDEYQVIDNKNARRVAGVLKAIGRVGLGAALGQDYQK
jgi:hypothetical protein